MSDTQEVSQFWGSGGRDFFMQMQRITTNPDVCGGKPCIRGLRFPVSRLLGLLAAGETQDAILNAYPYLEQEDFAEALAYAALLADEQIIEFAR
jgi:uncharacterized protein (DUF433 family)